MQFFNLFIKLIVNILKEFLISYTIIYSQLINEDLSQEFVLGIWSYLHW